MEVHYPPITDRRKCPDMRRVAHNCIASAGPMWDTRIMPNGGH